MKKGTLKSGSGKKVTSKKQAVAIGLSEVRKVAAYLLDQSKISQHELQAVIDGQCFKIHVPRSSPDLVLLYA